jgi:hypothetical protein
VIIGSVTFIFNAAELPATLRSGLGSSLGGVQP